MATFLATSAHTLLNLIEGWAVSRHLASDWGIWGRVSLSILTGIYFETILIFILLLLGYPVSWLPGALGLFAVTLLSLSLRKRRGSPLNFRLAFSKFKPRWYEIIVFLFLLEKVVFALWALQATPVYFDDALTHWSARGRAIFGVVNWSFDPDSPLFMGFTGHKHYPLMIPLWRAATASFAGEWNDIFARVDGLIFFVLLIIILWSAVNHFSRSRLLAAVSAFLLLSLPFHVWHSFSGFADIGVEVFCLASMAALLRREWFIAGVLAAGTAWAKNDGLVLFIPPLFLSCLLIQRSLPDLIFSGARFLLGLLSLLPWLIFKYLYMPGIAPGKEGFAWHSDVYSQFLKIIVNGPTHTVFWMFSAALFFLTLRRMLGDPFGRAMVAFYLASFSSILFVFGMTDAYRFLVNEMTIHRTMLQYYAVSVMISLYAVTLHLKNRDSFDR